MPTSTTASHTVSARTQCVHSGSETYAYRRFGGGQARRLLFLQHFMGTLDNWVAASQIAAFRDWEHNSGHGPLFQFHESFTRHAAAFLASDSPFAPY